MRRPAIVIILSAVVLVAAIGAVVWWKFFLSEKQVFANDAERFKYESLDGELVAGIPYPIFMILPRVFPDLVEKYSTTGYGPQKAGYGGYGAFGLAWEQGQRLPIGLSIKRLGYERVTANCALCHTTTYRTSPVDDEHFAIGGPGQSANISGLLQFLFAAARDRRFTAARLMPELAVHFPLDKLDWLIYSFILIPQTRLALHVAEQQLAWTAQKPPWGPGRDDAFNLPKYILTQTPWDDTVGNTDFPALWGLTERRGHLFHAGGEATSVYAIVATSALGAGSFPRGSFEPRNRWIESYLNILKPPTFPFPIKPELVARGRELFATGCVSCHGPGGEKTGTAIGLSELGTDPEHYRTWREKDADRMNDVTGGLGVRHAELQAAQGYVARPLVGVWLLGPYLHNGSVPSLWDLLSKPDQRPKVFYRGLDIIDADRVGFVSTGPQAQAQGFRFDTQLRGNSNSGHLYGTDLSEADKQALIEYLKTL